MRASPEEALAAFIRSLGHTPPDSVKWGTAGGRPQRIRCPEARSAKDSAYLYTFPDQAGGVFGCNKCYIEEKWFHERSRPEGMSPAEWKKAQQEARDRAEAQALINAEKREKARSTARNKSGTLWKDASTVIDYGHAYLKNKGITDARGVRMHDGKLVVPMKTIEAHGTIVNVQTIGADGEKRFMAGGQVVGTRTTVGARKDAEVFYVTEGWATAQSIHQVTGMPVVVCFSAGNMATIVRYLVAEYPTQKIIIAADNDRWNYSDHKGHFNTGVDAARALSDEFPQIEVAIPDFTDLDTKPTDFNDLLLLEGVDVVKYWLTPEKASMAVTTVVVEEGGEPEVNEEEPEEGQEAEGGKEEGEEAYPTYFDPGRAPFRILGYDGEHYIYLPSGKGKVTKLTPREHQKLNLFTLAPATYWEQTFPGARAQKVDWDQAADTLIQHAHLIGVFEENRMRGRGCWREENTKGKEGTLVHLGDRLLNPNGVWVDPHKFESPTRYIYQRQSRLPGHGTVVMEVEEAAWILETCRSILWSEVASGDILAGWIALAPICGLLKWRPHVWVTGERGTGKTTIGKELVKGLLGDVALDTVGGSTEAGIRGSLKHDSLPVIFDEAEEDETAGSRIQGVLALARQSSSETDATTLKGTAFGGSISYHTRSMFYISSIAGAIKEEADRSRIALLQLQGLNQVPHSERQQHWDSLRLEFLKVSEDKQMSRRLFARMVGFARSGMLDDTIKIFIRAASTAMGDNRLGDQFGTLYGGAWCLQSDKPPNPMVAREIMSSHDISSYQEDSMPEGLKLLHLILQQRERADTKNGPKTMAVSEIVQCARGATALENTEMSKEEAQRMLGQLGMRVEYDGGWCLQVSNSHEWITKVVSGTIFSRGVRMGLRSLPGAKAAPYPIRFAGGPSQRATSIPLYVVE